MKKQERQEQILSILRQDPDRTVTWLSAALDVSQVTIRKDLTEMEEAGLLIRSYGKAVLPKQAAERSSSCFIPPEAHGDYQKKQVIGALAADLVSDEDFIFLGPGYTCLEVARNLRGKKRLTIMTTNISAAIELSGVPEFQLRIAPGDFTKRNGTYYVTGPAVAAYFEQVYFDKIFITVDGVSLERGFSVLDESTAQIFRSIIKPGSQVLICATSSKFGKNALTPLGEPSLASAIISDCPLPDSFGSHLRENGVRIVVPK